MRRKLLATFALLCFAGILLAASSQQFILQFQNAGTTIGTWVSYVKINCSTGMSCSASGSTVTLTGTGSGSASFSSLTPGTNTSTTPWSFAPGSTVGGSTPNVTMAGPASDTNTGAVLALSTGASSTQPPFNVLVQGVEAFQVIEITGNNQQEIAGLCAATPSASTDVARFVHCDTSAGITGIRNLNTNAAASTGIQAEQTAAAGTGGTLFSGRVGVNTNGALGTGSQVFSVNDSGVITASGAINAAGGTMTGELITLAPATGSSGFNLPPGTAPTAPNNGDTWTTSAGLYVQIAGATVGPLIANLGYPLSFGSGAAVSNSATDYVSIGHMSNSATTDSINVPRNGTISNLFCRDSGSITAGTGTVVLTAYYNSTAEALTCTLNNTNQNACSDTTAGHAFSVVAGNALAIQSVPTAGSSTITGGIVACTVIYQ